MQQGSVSQSKGMVMHKRAKYLVRNDILNFHEAILGDPVLIHRFMKVREPVILSLANKMLDLLRLRWNEGLQELIPPFFELRVLDRVTEAEVDALFSHFLKECNLEGYDVAGDYWICVDRIKRKNEGYRDGVHTTLEFYEEALKNSTINSRFLGLSRAKKLHMSKEVMKVINYEKPEAELATIFEKHRRMKITHEEFDEFIRLYFRMCAPSRKYLSKVWYNVVKIKKAMIPNVIEDISEEKTGIWNVINDI